MFPAKSVNVSQSVGSEHRLDRYYGQEPCYDAREKDEAVMYAPAAADSGVAESVTLKRVVGGDRSQMPCGNDEILVLRGKRNWQLKRWLTRIMDIRYPMRQKEVLDPYMQFPT